MLELQYVSDLHLEFPENSSYLKKNPIIPQADILVCAGDTYYLEQEDAIAPFLDQVSKDFEEVFMIPGNHEYYGKVDTAESFFDKEKELRDNVYMVNNAALELKGINVIFSTLWSQITEGNARQIQDTMYDFRKIYTKGEQLSITNYNYMHGYCVESIKQLIREDINNVLITHHAPLFDCIADEYKGHYLNEAFYADMTEFIKSHNISNWIYGHTHGNIEDFDKYGTTFSTNQLGYVGQNDTSTFDHAKVIRI